MPSLSSFGPSTALSRRSQRRPSRVLHWPSVGAPRLSNLVQHLPPANDVRLSASSTTMLHPTRNRCQKHELAQRLRPQGSRCPRSLLRRLYSDHSNSLKDKNHACPRIADLFPPSTLLLLTLLCAYLHHASFPGTCAASFYGTESRGPFSCLAGYQTIPPLSTTGHPGHILA